MPTYKVRTYEENLEVVADTVEFVDGVCALFKIGGRVTARFSRYLWVQEVVATDADPAAPEAPAPQPEPTTEPAPDTQPE